MDQQTVPKRKTADRSDRLTSPAGTPPRHLVTALFAVTGFSALCLQVVWQRVISIHGGVDLFSSTTVVAAFMAGLGLGNIVGGALAAVSLLPRASAALRHSVLAAAIGCDLLTPILQPMGPGQ